MQCRRREPTVHEELIRLSLDELGPADSESEVASNDRVVLDCVGIAYEIR
jgi:hypothetical protein